MSSEGEKKDSFERGKSSVLLNFKMMKWSNQLLNPFRFYLFTLKGNNRETKPFRLKVATNFVCVSKKIQCKFVEIC